MTKKHGTLLKMKSELNDPVDYFLPIGEEKVYLNDLIGSEIEINYAGKIHCIRCGRATKKSFHQGYCYPCYQTAPQTDDCILRPELCRAHEGVSRDMEWSKNNCLQDHIIYLANTSGLKVGVTRLSQVPTRWIDQGASFAIKIAKAPDRYTAGLIEVNLKKHFADKTNWRNMLANKIDPGINLLEQKQKARAVVKKELANYFIDDDELIEITYPVLQFPTKVKSVNLDKEALIKGRLTGIKGQYLIFEDNSVMNIRRHNGYEVELVY